METNSVDVALYVVIGVTVLAVILYVHFLPAIFAFRRRHPSRTAILLLNLIFGWTLIGWVVALLWALAGYDAQRDASRFRLIDH